MDFNETCASKLLEDGKNNWSDFGNLDLIFKVTGGQRMLKNALSSSSLCKGLIDWLRPNIGVYQLEVEKN